MATRRTERARDALMAAMDTERDALENALEELSAINTSANFDVRLPRFRELIKAVVEASTRVSDLSEALRAEIGRLG